MQVCGIPGAFAACRSELLRKQGPDTANMLPGNSSSHSHPSEGPESQRRSQVCAVCNTQHLLQFIWQEFSRLLLRKQATWRPL